MSYDVILTEDLPHIYKLDPVDEKFLSEDLKLIQIKNGRIYSKFVGEIITPHTKIFSLPKNLEDNKLIEPIKRLLEKFKNKGGNLSLNSTFTISKTGGYKSDLYFYKRLKSFFLDFVTYEFIYPLETIKIHSIEPLVGKIDIIQTNINRQIYGDGITYDVTDKKNSDDWILDDIYCFTIKKLVNLVGSTSEQNEIKKMKEYLVEDGGYFINEIEEVDENYIMTNSKNKEIKFTIDEIIQKIKKCNVNIIHEPIKNTLIEYYQHRKLASSSFTVNVFYTKNFEVVWEKLVQTALKHQSSDFLTDEGKPLSDSFNKTVSFRDYVPESEEDKFLKDNKIKKDDILQRDPQNPNYLVYRALDKRPDLFSSGSSVYSKDLIDGKLRFIGDAKYYNNIKADFSKEYSDYNIIQKNKYPMVILSPSDKTNIPLRTNRIPSPTGDDKRELIIINISIIDIINDYLDSKTEVLSTVHKLIRKRSSRIFNQTKPPHSPEL
jgi:hypothetical protein